MRKIPPPPVPPLVPAPPIPRPMHRADPPATLPPTAADTTDDLATAATIALEASTAILEHNIHLAIDIERTNARCHSLEAENEQLRRAIAAAQQEIDRRALRLSLLLHARHGLPVNYQ